jgi:hypothetical protein
VKTKAEVEKEIREVQEQKRKEELERRENADYFDRNEWSLSPGEYIKEFFTL